MAIKIRNDEKVCGIKFRNIEYKICRLADDTTIFVKDTDSIIQLLSVLKKFQNCSGLKINVEKTEVIPVGIYKFKNKTLPKEISRIKINHGSFKTLGIWFSYNSKENVELNFEVKLKKMEIILNIWKKRSLSLKGKILIMKTLVLPQVNYLLSVCYCPDHILQRIDKMLFNFLWNNKKAKIKRSTIIATYSAGGLKMPDIYGIHFTSKIKWIKNLLELSAQQGKWQHLTWHLFNTPQHLFRKKLTDCYENKCLTLFHRQSLKCWLNFYAESPVTVNDVYNEYIFDNKYICSAGKPLQAKYFKLLENQTTSLIVADLTNGQGQFLSLEEFKERSQLKIDKLSYNKIISSVPKDWKEKIKNMPSSDIIKSSNPKVLIRKKFTDITRVNNKVLYWAVLQHKIHEPTSLYHWIETYPFMEAAPCHKIFTLTSTIRLEPYFHSFQYKLINRLLNCNYNLYTWKIKDSPSCNHCGQIDTIEHHLFYCSYSKIFWKEIQIWMQKNLTVTTSCDYTVCEILFGIGIQERNMSAPVTLENIIILLAKWFLNRLKVESKPFIISEFINLLKRKLEIYRVTFGSTESLERVDNEMQKLIQFTLNKITSAGF